MMALLQNKTKGTKRKPEECHPLWSSFTISENARRLRRLCIMLQSSPILLTTDDTDFTDASRFLGDLCDLGVENPIPSIPFA
jgi:hypothetical protein